MAHDGMTTEQWNAQQEARTREAFEARIQREEDAKKARKRHQDTMEALSARSASHKYLSNLGDAEKHLAKVESAARPAIERLRRAHREREALEKQNTDREAETKRLEDELARLKADSLVDGLTPGQEQELAKVTSDLAALKSDDGKASDAMLTALVNKAQTTAHDLHPLALDVQAARHNVAQLKALALQNELADVRARADAAVTELQERERDLGRMARNEVELTPHHRDGFGDVLAFALKELKSDAQPIADSE